MAVFILLELELLVAVFILLELELLIEVELLVVFATLEDE